MVAMHCYHMRQVYGFLELPHVVAMHCYHMRQVYGFLELLWWQCIVTNEASLWILGVAPCGGNALLPHEASLWILGVASCGGNALLPHELQGSMDSTTTTGVVVVACIVTT